MIRSSPTLPALLLGTWSFGELFPEARCRFPVSHNVISSFRLPENLGADQGTLGEWLANAQ